MKRCSSSCRVYFLLHLLLLLFDDDGEVKIGEIENIIILVLVRVGWSETGREGNGMDDDGENEDKADLRAKGRGWREWTGKVIYKMKIERQERLEKLVLKSRWFSSKWV